MRYKIIQKNNEPAWFHAIVDNDIKYIENWIKETDNINEADEEGQTPLHWACFLKKIDIVNMLLKNNADPYSQDLQSVFPYQLALQFPETEEWNYSQWPQTYPAAFNISDKESYLLQVISKTIVQFTTQKNYNAIKCITKILPAEKCQRCIYFTNNMDIHSIPWVHMAFILKSKELLSILIEDWKLSINQMDNDNKTALDMAIADENQEWIKNIVQLGGKFTNTTQNILGESVLGNIDLCIATSPEMAAHIANNYSKEVCNETIKIKDILKSAYTIHGIEKMTHILYGDIFKTIR